MNISHLHTRLGAILFLFLVCASTGFAIDLSSPDTTPASILVYPYYTSRSSLNSDTRITIANTEVYQLESTTREAIRTATVHLIFIDGRTCTQSDLYLCLSPYAAFTFNASAIDPEVTGYLLAVAVDTSGNLTRQNSLIGDAFVSEGNYHGNYTAEGFRAYGNPGITKDSKIYFGNRPNGAPLVDAYDYAPMRFAVTIQSPVDVSEQRLVTASISGDTNMATPNSAAQVGVGYVFNGNERPSSSFSSFHVGSCLVISHVTPTSPRVAFTMAKIIPPGQIGTLMFSTGPAVGLLMTPKGNSRWSGIRALHKSRVTNATLVIPSFMPSC